MMAGVVKLIATILGCGSSGGVPRLGYGWGSCDPNESRNRRRRCSLLIERLTERGSTRVLVDTGPDMRQQLLDANVTHIDGVLYTHDHADHTHGIDDLRVLALQSGNRIDSYADPRTADVLRQRFGYCFATPTGSQYPPILNLNPLTPGTMVLIDGAGGSISTTPFLQHHGDIDSLGFRFNSLAYSSDSNGFPPESVDYLENLDILILDALRYRPHPSHFSISDALAWIARLKPKRAILTNLHTDLDYRALERSLPSGVEPAYDGMTFEFAGSG